MADRRLAGTTDTGAVDPGPDSVEFASAGPDDDRGPDCGGSFSAQNTVFLGMI